MQANKQDVSRLLKTAKGQIDGILKMIEEDRYCMEISHQIMAAEAILNKANREVLLMSRGASRMALRAAMPMARFRRS